MSNKRFLLHKMIAKGGMAEIFLGKLLGEDGFERVCCLKRILPHYTQDEEFVQMFRDEAHIGKRLQHANIVRVEGFEEVEGSYAIVMEFIIGADLRTILSTCEKQNKRLTPAMAAYIVAEAARGLNFAHTREDDITHEPLGIVHRDISPQNILVSFQGEVKVTDFGIANAEDKITETKAGIVKGKFSYMSPEQIMAKPVDARTDVFALSVILWELLSMRRLFHAENEVHVIQMVKDCIIKKDLRSLNPLVDTDLETIVYRGLQKDLDQRFASASSMEKSLRRYLNRAFPDFTPDDLAEFLGGILTQRKDELNANIRELLKENISSGTSNATTKPRMVNKQPTSKTNHSSKIQKTPLPQVRRSSPTQNKRIRPKQTNTNRSRASLKPKSSWGFLKSMFLLACLSGALFLSYRYYQKQQETPIFQWKISTVPSTVKLKLNDDPLFEGAYRRTPVVLRKLPLGEYTISASRPGFRTESLTQLFEKKSGLLKSDLVLEKLERMAPIEVSSRGKENLTIKVDDGIIVDEIKPGSTKKLKDVIYGREHTLHIRTESGVEFTCNFTPRSSNWTNPYRISINPAAQGCTLP